MKSKTSDFKGERAKVREERKGENIRKKWKCRGEKRVRRRVRIQREKVDEQRG